MGWGFCEELQRLQTAAELFGKMGDAIRFVTAHLRAERNDHQAETVRKAKVYMEGRLLLAAIFYHLLQKGFRHAAAGIP